MAASKNTEKKEKNWLHYIWSGEFLTEEFVTKQFKLLILIVFLIIVFISNRYSCIKEFAEIEKLKTQLKDIEDENSNISRELTTTGRPSQIEEIMAAKGIELRSSKASVYEIHK